MTGEVGRSTLERQSEGTIDMSNSENSALVALSELKNLEANRVAQEEAERLAAIEAERQAREAAERAAREQAERIAREQAEQYAREQAEREAREREERIRVQEADARARAEQEARLREEQMRIDAQMRMAEKKAKPKWPLVVVPILVVVLGFGGFLSWQSAKHADEQAQRDAEERARLIAEKEKQDAVLAEITAEIKRLKEEQAALEESKSDLDKRLAAAQTDAERARILAEKQDLEDKLEENKAKQTRSNTKRKVGSSSSSSSKDAAAAEPEPLIKGRKDKINLGGGDDPLSGL
jgi:colicin import membrane protein